MLRKCALKALRKTTKFDTVKPVNQKLSGPDGSIFFKSLLELRKHHSYVRGQTSIIDNCSCVFKFIMPDEIITQLSIYCLPITCCPDTMQEAGKSSTYIFSFCTSAEKLFLRLCEHVKTFSTDSSVHIVGNFI